MDRIAALLACLVRGHTWDVSPWRAPGQMRCVRCELGAEPVPHLH